MERISIQPRGNWKEAVEKLGFGFHSTNVPYWDESAYYKFSMDEILYIEKATAELWQMCLAAVQFVIDKKEYAKFHIPEWMVPHIEKTWNEDSPAIYGRFDFAYNNGKLKLLEFNADTPTSLYEAGIIQWYWLKDFANEKDQFNSVHEKLIDYWRYLKPYLYQNAKLHFSCLKSSLEDLTNVEYMRDCAIQAGIETKLIYIEDIGWDKEKQVFLDLENEEIKNIFKLYPYEWMAKDDFGQNLIADKNQSLWIEPSWKMILSNKSILPILYSLFPECPYLLKTFFKEEDLLAVTNGYVKKPILSREGSNIQIIKDGKVIEQTVGGYGEEGYVYQEIADLSNTDGNYMIIGSWVIGQEPAGMGIRESNSLITNNVSRFVPHLIEN